MEVNSLMKRSLVSVSLATLIITGCANNPLKSYKQTTDSRFQQISSGNLLAAMQAESTNDVLFNMEYGTLLRINQDYESSNRYFTIAQSSIDAWVTSWSNTTAGQIGKTTMSMLINDSVNDYDPKSYEKTFLPTMHALNNADLNNLDNARIEIKKMYQTEIALENYNQYMYNQAQTEAANYQKDKQQSNLYSQITQKYDFKDINSPEVLALKNSYQNAFSHYLAGFIFEALNEPSLARPGYVKAGQLQPTSKLIQQSIDNIDKNKRPAKGYTDLLIVEEVGHAPLVKSNQINIPFNISMGANNASCPVVLNVFYPSLIPDTINNSSYTINFDNNYLNPERFTDVDLMAARAIKDDIPRITARNIAAAVRNIATTQASCSAGGNLGSLLNLTANIGGILLDNIDERNWNLLPSKINVSRTTVGYGKHTISVNVNGTNYTKTIELNQPYQIITFRILKNQVFFDTQKPLAK